MPQYALHRLRLDLRLIHQPVAEAMAHVCKPKRKPSGKRSKAPDKHTMLEKSWTLLESIRVKLNQMVERETARLQESPKAN